MDYNLKMEEVLAQVKDKEILLRCLEKIANYECDDGTIIPTVEGAPVRTVQLLRTCASMTIPELRSVLRTVCHQLETIETHHTTVQLLEQIKGELGVQK